MQIIDKSGYLESALDYIEKNLASGKGLAKIAAKTGIKENSIRTLSLKLRNFSENQFFTQLQEKIEANHSSLGGAEVEISGADISVEMQKGKYFVYMNLNLDIVIEGEIEDRMALNVKIFSKNNILIS